MKIWFSLFGGRSKGSAQWEQQGQAQLEKAKVQEIGDFCEDVT